MAIPTIDVNKTHSVISKYDEGEPKNVFVVRTLSTSQKMNMANKAAELKRLADDPEKMWRAMLELFEMLIVDVVGISVEKVDGVFGKSVSKEYADKIFPAKIITEIVTKAIDINTLDEESEKNLSGQSVGVN